ncbi:MAG: helix-turn-helix domain containing protein [Treponema sp.]|jgi:transcriptional regulator with XRE-family HTH domain|nr:helix-turn-helix domain containing protein [Treponema sp.]
MDINGHDIVERIDNRLEAMGFGRKVLLIDLDIPKTTISSWSVKSIVPRADELYRVATFLKVSVVWLLTGEDECGLAPDERDLLDSYRRLDDRDRQDVVGIIAVKLSRYEQSYGQGERVLT